MTSARRAVWFVLALACVAGTAALAQDDISEQQKELERIRSQIQAHRDESKKLSSREQQTLKNLQRLDREIELQKQYLHKLGEQETAVDRRVGELLVQIGGREATLSQQEEALARRVRTMYMQDPQYRWEVVLGAKSIEDAVTRYEFMRVIAEQDAKLIGEVTESKRRLETESSRLNEALQTIAEVRSDREAENARLEDAKQRRKTTLTQIRSEKSKHVEAIEELEEAQARVQAILDDIARGGANDKDLPPSGEFAAMKGRLLWPVAGKVIRGFGKHTHPKYGTVTMNNGLDIQATAGAPIVAVAAGVVEFVDWIDAFGKCVILNHGGGYYTLYAHVASTMVTQGQKIGRGQAIAEVGDTGSLEGYVCHFEVRQGRRALDPTGWLGRKKSL
jgi:murein hydrolase activator